MKRGYERTVEATDALIQKHGMKMFGDRRTAFMVACALNPDTDPQDGAPGEIDAKPNGRQRAQVDAIVGKLKATGQVPALERIDSLARERAERKGISVSAAYAEVMSEPEGEELYAKYLQERQ